MHNRLLVGLVLVLALIAGVWASIALNAPKEVSALYYQPARALKPFQLIDHNGNAFTKNELQNHWTLVFTGYTYCPDICPTTLANLNLHFNDLNVQVNQQLKVLLLSVDPKRDTPERLNEYISYFNPDFLAATAEHKQLFPFVRNLGLMYSMSGDTEQQNYLVDHSASIVLLNPEGNIQAIFKPKHELGQLPSVDFEEMKQDLHSIYSNF